MELEDKTVKRLYISNGSNKTGAEQRRLRKLDSVETAAMRATAEAQIWLGLAAAARRLDGIKTSNKKAAIAATAAVQT